MNSNHTFSTILYKDTEAEEIDVIVYFTVPKEWADRWCKDNGYDSLEEFDMNYIWDDSYEMYESAIEENVIVCIEEDESVIHTW